MFGSGATTGQGTAGESIALKLAPSWPSLHLPPRTLVQVAVDAAVAPIPNCARWFRGVLGRRGAIVPVFDIAAWAGDPLSDLARGHIVVLGSGPDAFALVCCEVPMLGGSVERRLDAALALPDALTGHVSLPSSTAAAGSYTFDARAWVASVAQSLVL